MDLSEGRRVADPEHPWRTTIITSAPRTVSVRRTSSDVDGDLDLREDVVSVPDRTAYCRRLIHAPAGTLTCGQVAGSNGSPDGFSATIDKIQPPGNPQTTGRFQARRSAMQTGHRAIRVAAVWESLSGLAMFSLPQ
jgi:hypothetical protein